MQTLANQMAPRIASGESEYSSLDLWSAWIMEDWSEGVGKTRPHRRSGGFLFSTCETRVPNQIILPQASVCPYVQAGSTVTAGLERLYMPDSAGSFFWVTVGSGSRTKLAVKIDADDYPTNAVATPQALFLIETNGLQVGVRISVYNDSAGTPGTQQQTGTLTIPSGIMGPYWAAVSHTTYAPASVYWLVIEKVALSNDFSVVGSGARSGSPVSKKNDGNTWSADTFYPFFTHGSPNRHRSIFGGVSTSVGGSLFSAGQLAANGVYAYAYNDGTGSIDGSASIVADAQPYNHPPTYALNRMYVPTSGNLYYTNASGAFPVDTGVAVTVGMVKATGGFIWRVNTRSPYYSNDGTNWIQPTDTSGAAASAGMDPELVTGMAEMDGSHYIATTRSLYAVRPGDFLTWVGDWPAASLIWFPNSPIFDAPNGRGLVNWRGSLYAIVNHRVWRFSADGSFQDIWFGNEDAPAGRLDKVKAIGVGPGGLYAATQGTIAIGGTPTAYWSALWCMPVGGNGWHFLENISGAAVSVFYDSGYSRLYTTMTDNSVWRYRESAYSLNPYRDYLSKFNPAGWVEWDWFRGNVRENDKDWESVTIMGEFPANTGVSVYWKDSASTNWEFLGTADADGEELIWPVSTRPTDPAIKLGLYLYTTDPDVSPKVEAVRVKYMTMVKDWFRWNLNVDVSGGLNDRPYQEMLNGEYNTYTAAQIKANLDVLASQVAPFVYTDTDGSNYLVKMQAATFNYDKVLYNSGAGNKEFEGTYSIAIEQVRPGTYTAP